MELEELQAQIQLLTAEKTALEVAIAEKTTENESLKMQLTKAENGSSIAVMPTEKPKLVLPTETFTVKGKKYRFLLPLFRLGVEKYLAADIMKNDELLAKLAAEYPSVVELV